MSAPGTKPVKKKTGPYSDKSLAYPSDWQTYVQRETEINDAEKQRLLYVAATRSKDLLVVCYRTSSEGDANKSNPWSDLIGHLGGDPEVRHLENGTAVARFSLATNESYKDKEGNWQTLTEWHNIVVWREQAERAEKQLKKGMLIGAPVVGVRMKLQDGQYHDVDSSDIAFRIAAMAAIREIYMAAKPTILEPIMKLEVQAPEEFQGTVMGQINQRRGVIQGSSTMEGYVTIESLVPLVEMFGYSTDLRSATQGKGEFTMELRYTVPVETGAVDVIIVF